MAGPRRPQGFLQPVQELLGYFQDSAALLGLRAAPWNPAQGSNAFDPATAGPEEEAMRAAREWRIVHDALSTLQAEHQRAIRAAYTPRNELGRRADDAEGRQLELKHGIAAAVVREVRAEHAAALAAAQTRVDELVLAEAAMLGLSRHPLLPPAARPLAGIGLLEAKVALSGARAALTAAKQAAEQAEHEGVERLRAAHREYIAARRVQRAHSRHEAAEARQRRQPRAELRVRERIQGGHRAAVKRVSADLLRIRALANLQACGVEAAE